MIEETGAHRPGDSVLKMDSSSPGDAGQEQEDGGQDSVRIWSFTFHRKKNTSENKNLCDIYLLKYCVDLSSISLVTVKTSDQLST